MAKAAQSANVWGLLGDWGVISGFMSKRHKMINPMLKPRKAGPSVGVRARNLPRSWRQDSFHRLMSLSMARLLSIFVGVFVLFNLAFAGLYSLDPAGLVITRELSGVPEFWRNFFFSVHTVATIGYGNIYPGDLYTNSVVVVEITLGIIIFALVTGLAFARFSRPTARILFSQKLVVHSADGVPTLMLRAANQRHNLLYSAEAKLAVLVDADVGGIRLRRFADLKLVRSANPTFALTWLIMHQIDEDSPLRDWVKQGFASPDAELVIILSGTDEGSGQLVHARWAYNAMDVVWGGRFVDIVSTDHDGVRSIDYGQFHDVASD
jgi:inward rectifier potassium channel